MSIEGTEFPLEEEYKKETGISEADVSELRQWLKTQPHLPEKYITDLDLILAYHSCNNSFNVTKEVLDLHYTLKTHFTPYFENRSFDLNRIEAVFKSALLTPLQARTREGYVIFYARFLNLDAKYFNFTEVLRALFLIIDVWQHEEGTWPGFLVLIDYEGFNLRLLAKYDLLNVQRALYYFQEANLVRLKGFHLINASSIVDKLLMLIKPFTKKKFNDVLVVHPAGNKDIDKYLPLEALPVDCGGNYKSSQQCLEGVLDMLRRNIDYIEAENKKRVTESLRPGKPKTISDIFGGVEGSFKKLEID